MKRFLLYLTFLFSLTIVAREPEEIQQDVTNSNEQRYRVSNSDVTFELPRFVFDYTNTRVTVKFSNPKHQALTLNNNELNLIVNGQPQAVKFDDKGVGYFYFTFKDKNNMQILFEDVNHTIQASVISIWYIIIPLMTLLIIFAFKVLQNNKSKNTKLTIAHKENIPEDNMDDEFYAPNLRVVKVKEKEEVF